VRVLITGGTGQVGHALLQTIPAGCTAITPDRKTLNLADRASLPHALQSLAPDALINAAGYTAVDRAESEPDLANSINAFAAAELAIYCRSAGIPMIHVSTDYVFDGKKQTPYLPNETPSATAAYGYSKLLGEQLATKRNADVFIVRSGWIYGTHGNNFVKTMLKLAGEGKSLRVVNDQIGAPTFSQNLAKFLWQVLLLQPSQKILHCSDRGELSWYEFAAEIFATARGIGLLDKQPELSPCSSSEYPSAARRPAYSVLDCASSFSAVKMQQINWRDALTAMLMQLKSGDDAIPSQPRLRA